MMQFLLFLVAATLLLGLTEGFIVTRHRTQIMSSNAAVSRSMKLSSMVSYKERLELARKEKQDRANGIVPERLREKKNEKKNASRLPMNSHEMKGPLFSKEIEDSINFVVDILRTRSQSDDPLSFTDLNRLELAIESIIADARRSSDAGISVERTQRDAFKEATERDQDHRKKDTFYGAFRGFGSTWQVDNMDKMSTEEYYDAINKRNAAIREARKSDENFDRESAMNYMESLSGGRR